MKRKKLISLSWADFSRKFVKRHGLPLGTTLRLYDQNGRQKRSDWQVKSRRFKSMDQAHNRDSVSDLLGIATSQLSTDIEAQRLTLHLVSPHGQQINGNTLIRTVRAMPRARTDYDDEESERRDWEISELRNVADMELNQAEHLIDDPADVVVHAYVSALVDRYGRHAVEMVFPGTR